MKISSYIKYLLRGIFNDNRNRNGRGLRWSQTGRRYCSSYFQNIIDKLCINVTKMTSNAEYLIPRIFNNAKNKSGRGPKPEVG